MSSVYSTYELFIIFISYALLFSTEYYNGALQYNKRWFVKNNAFALQTCA